MSVKVVVTLHPVPGKIVDAVVEMVMGDVAVAVDPATVPVAELLDHHDHEAGLKAP